MNFVPKFNYDVLLFVILYKFIHSVLIISNFYVDYLVKFLTIYLVKFKQLTIVGNLTCCLLLELNVVILRASCKSHQEKIIQQEKRTHFIPKNVFPC